MAGVVEQPGAVPGQRSFCPVSGALFTISATSPVRDVGGARYYFCCEGCATYFAQHASAVLAARGR